MFEGKVLIDGAFLFFFRCLERCSIQANRYANFSKSYEEEKEKMKNVSQHDLKRYDLLKNTKFIEKFQSHNKTVFGQITMEKQLQIVFSGLSPLCPVLSGAPNRQNFVSLIWSTLPVQNHNKSPKWFLLTWSISGQYIFHNHN